MSSTPGEYRQELGLQPSQQEAALRNIYRRFFKRALDLAIALPALVVLTPVILTAMAIIRLESPGSPLFSQKRLGKNGQLFQIYKIRTMYPDSDKKDFKTRTGDPRITPIGHFLRDTKIDELPQLWNIIRGDMSLIGPRPLSVDECNYVTQMLKYNERHPGFCPTVRPGLTGLEQIYRINPLVYSERFEWNHHYENSLSFIMDLKVLYSTAFMCRLVCYLALFATILEVFALHRWLSR